MNKIITTLVLLIAITFNSYAQDKKQTAKETATSDAADITTALGLNETQKQDFFRLFVHKQEVLVNPDLSFERKKEMVRVVGLKIEASINGDQLEKLKKLNIYNKLTGQTFLEQLK